MTSYLYFVLGERMEHHNIVVTKFEISIGRGNRKRVNSEQVSSIYKRDVEILTNDLLQRK